MCGIAGLVIRREMPDMSGRLEVMTDVMTHRGPDDRGLYVSPAGRRLQAGLGHRRLSIVDLGGGHQPMTNETGDIWITYNGEIYNHQALRPALEAQGHRYHSRSDTETIIHAYEQYGVDCVHKLRGMWAFAIWDETRQRLFMSRDRLGIKPLYYTIHNGVLCFASEIKALLASRTAPPVVNDAALPEFLTFGYTCGEETLFQGIQKLMPGHWLTWDGDTVTVQSYWDWQFEEGLPYRDDAAYQAEFDTLLDESVRLRLMSDVPLGMFLSGGIDSSLIAAYMARHVSTPIKTFAVGFESQYYSEFPYARAVADHLGTEHHETVVKSSDFFEALPKLIWHEDEPLHGPASVALYFVAKLAREHVTVVLTGEGSDELFAGYNDRYWVTLMNRRLAQLTGGGLPDRLRRHVVRRWLWHMPLPLKLKKVLSHTILYHAPTPEGMLFDNFYGVFTREMQHHLRGAGASSRGRDAYAQATQLLQQSNAEHFLHQMLYADVKSYLLELLMKQDQMSMAVSLESRVPFLDHELVGFAGTVPPHLRLRGRSGKWLVKQVALRGNGQAPLLPKHVVHRPKMGFPVPFAAWLTEDHSSGVRDILLEQRTRQRGYFQPAYVERLLDDHQQGRRDCFSQIWMLLNFELWQRTFFDGASPGLSRV